MAKLVLRDCFIEIDSVDFSDHASQVEIQLKKMVVDTTNFSGGGKEAVPGLKDDEISVTFQQDFAAGEVNAVLFQLWDDEEEFIVKVRPGAGAISAANPEFSATCRIFDYSPLAGKVGDLSDTKVKFAAQRSGIAMAIA
jgi:hypothetical protein